MCSGTFNLDETFDPTADVPTAAVAAHHKTKPPNTPCDSIKVYSWTYRTLTTALEKTFPFACCQVLAPLSAHPLFISSSVYPLKLVEM